MDISAATLPFRTSLDSLCRVVHTLLRVPSGACTFKALQWLCCNHRYATEAAFTKLLREAVREGDGYKSWIGSLLSKDDVFRPCRLPWIAQPKLVRALERLDAVWRQHPWNEYVLMLIMDWVILNKRMVSPEYTAGLLRYVCFREDSLRCMYEAYLRPEFELLADSCRDYNI